MSNLVSSVPVISQPISNQKDNVKNVNKAVKSSYSAQQADLGPDVANCCLPIYIGEACQAKWKYLRDMYRRQRKEQKEKKSGSEGGTGKRPWRYLGILSFLDPHVPGQRNDQ